jgi:hypothetical protein
MLYISKQDRVKQDRVRVPRSLGNGHCHRHSHFPLHSLGLTEKMLCSFITVYLLSGVSFRSLQPMINRSLRLYTLSMAPNAHCHAIKAVQRNRVRHYYLGNVSSEVSTFLKLMANEAEI